MASSYTEYDFTAIAVKSSAKDELANLKPDNDTWTSFLIRLADDSDTGVSE